MRNRHGPFRSIRVPAHGGARENEGEETGRRRQPALHEATSGSARYGQTWATRSTCTFNTSRVCWLAGTLTCCRASSMRW